MVRNLVASSANVGGDIRCLPMREFKSDAWPRHAINGEWWSWKTVVSYQWNHSFNDSINVLEARAILAAVKWRLRKEANLSSKFLHLSDSQVCLGAYRKFRSPAIGLQSVVSRVAALCLTASCKMILGYIPTDKNPADRPSRYVQTWAEQLKEDDPL